MSNLGPDSSGELPPRGPIQDGDVQPGNPESAKLARIFRRVAVVGGVATVGVLGWQNGGEDIFRALSGDTGYFEEKYGDDRPKFDLFPNVLLDEAGIAIEPFLSDASSIDGIELIPVPGPPRLNVRECTVDERFDGSPDSYPGAFIPDTDQLAAALEAGGNLVDYYSAMGLNCDKAELELPEAAIFKINDYISFDGTYVVEGESDSVIPRGNGPRLGDGRQFDGIDNALLVLGGNGDNQYTGSLTVCTTERNPSGLAGAKSIQDILDTPFDEYFPEDVVTCDSQQVTAHYNYNIEEQ